MLSKENMPFHWPDEILESVAYHTSIENLYELDSWVTTEALDKLSAQLVSIQNGEAFYFQGGDCAERFSESGFEYTKRKADVLNYYGHLIEQTLQKPVLKIARIAGQYGKPRSALMENKGGLRLPSFFGDIINTEAFTSEARRLDPRRMLMAASLSQKITKDLASYSKDMYTSHECFLLDYEQAVTRKEGGCSYNAGAHFLWLGARSLKSLQHIDYLSSIINPVGIKISADIQAAELVELVQRINPKNQAGKLTLIVRMGQDVVTESLPSLVKAIIDNQLRVTWVSDPMHANTGKDKYDIKYRLLGRLVTETNQMQEILDSFDLSLGGVHLEMTHREAVKECIFGLDEVSPNRFYDSACDPRLNPIQVNYFLHQVLANYKTNEEVLYGEQVSATY